MSNARRTLLNDCSVRLQTRRTLLTRVSQVAVLMAGLELTIACDRLPGQAPRVPRVGYIANESPAGAQTQALIAGLGDFGYVVGQNLEMESRFPTEVSQAASICNDLLQLGVDMLVTGGTAITVAAKQATSTVPIVGISVSKPLENGLVQSLARPGGNVTGISNGGFDVSKWLEPGLRTFRSFSCTPDAVAASVVSWTIDGPSAPPRPEVEVESKLLINATRNNPGMSCARNWISFPNTVVGKFATPVILPPG